MITIFRSRLRDDANGYAEHAARISALARTMPGYVDHKTFTAEDGERVTVVTFADEATHDAWRTNADHRDAQHAGVRDYYASYSIQVATVTKAHTFERGQGAGDA